MTLADWIKVGREYPHIPARQWRVAAECAFAYTRKWWGRMRGYVPAYVSEEDIQQAALLGLCHAAKIFDPSRASFNTPAYQWVRAFVEREFRSTYHVPQHVMNRARTAGKLGDLHSAVAPLLLDHEIGTHEHDPLRMVDTLPDETRGPESLGLAAAEGRRVRQALYQLGPFYAEPLWERLVEERTLKDIGRDIGLTQEGARKRIERGTEQLKALLQANDIPEPEAS